MERNQPGKYDDIIHLPRPVSSRRAHMSMVDRGHSFPPLLPWLAMKRYWRSVPA